MKKKFFILISMHGLLYSSVHLSLFTEEDKKSILENFNHVTSSSIPCEKQPKERLYEAARGIYIYPSFPNDEKWTATEICDTLYRAKEKNHIPLIQDDSLTAWGNQAAEQYGLQIKDILKLKHGDKLELVLMDRNVGEHLDYLYKTGDVYDPTQEGLVYAIYIHDKDLTGTLHLLPVEEFDILQPFTWEINTAAIGFNWFWGPIPSEIDWKNLDTRIKVGWRGPAILLSDAQKYLPRTCTHYENWWNDYLPFRKKNFLID